MHKSKHFLNWTDIAMVVLNKQRQKEGKMQSGRIDNIQPNFLDPTCTHKQKPKMRPLEHQPTYIGKHYLFMAPKLNSCFQMHIK